MLFRRAPEPPDPRTLRVEGVLLASEGRPIGERALELTAELAKTGSAPVHVLSIARVWGTGLGLPMPGLLPSKREWDAQRAVVGDAIRGLKRRGVPARGHVTGTRRPAKQIAHAAAQLRCSAIVMSADAPRHPLVGDLMWSQEPYRVRRRAKVPVYLLVEEAG